MTAKEKFESFEVIFFMYAIYGTLFIWLPICAIALVSYTLSEIFGIFTELLDATVFLIFLHLYILISGLSSISMGGLLQSLFKKLNKRNRG
jgi:hypothetical protein